MTTFTQVPGLLLEIAVAPALEAKAREMSPHGVKVTVREDLAPDGWIALTDKGEHRGDSAEGVAFDVTLRPFSYSVPA